MPEEIKKTILYTDWPTPDEVIEPSPSLDQETLWEKIHESVSGKDLENEVRFVYLPKKFRDYLASYELAEKIGRVGVKFNLVPPQLKNLARTIKKYFTKEVSFISLDNVISEDLKINMETAAAIRISLDEIWRTLMQPIEQPSHLVETNVAVTPTAPTTAPQPTTPKAEEKLIASPETAHPTTATSQQPLATSESRGTPSQISAMPPRPSTFSVPSQPSKPPSVMPAEAGTQGGSQIKFGMTDKAEPAGNIIMPKVEPLPVHPTPVPPPFGSAQGKPIPPRPAPTPPPVIASETKQSDNNANKNSGKIAASTTEVGTRNDKPTPIKIKVEPSRVPNFLNSEDFKNPKP